MQKSVRPKMLSLGSRVPTQARTCPMVQRYCSTWHILTGYPFCASSLVRTQYAKNVKRDGIVNVREVGLKPNACAVLFPLGPVCTIRFCITRRDSRFHCCPDSTVMSAYSSNDIRKTCSHKLCCGYLELKKARRALGVGWRTRKASLAS